MTPLSDAAADSGALAGCDIHREWLAGVLKCRIRRDDRPLRVDEVLCGLAAAGPAGGGVGATLTRAIATAPFAALFFETPPVTTATLERPFECVLIDAPPLAAMRPDPAAFADRFESEAGGITVFENLDGDAVLISPAPASTSVSTSVSALGPSVLDPAGAHLAAFLRHGDPAAVAALWRAAGGEMLRRIGERPLWLSTSGLGIAWLHVRIDGRPKYYIHAPYRTV